MLPSPLLRQQQATLLALLSGVCSKYHFQVRISKLPLETALGGPHTKFLNPRELNSRTPIGVVNW